MAIATNKLVPQIDVDSQAVKIHEGKVGAIRSVLSGACQIQRRKGLKAPACSHSEIPLNLVGNFDPDSLRQPEVVQCRPAVKAIGGSVIGELILLSVAESCARDDQRP